MAGYTTKLSSAGLVYKHYGRQIVAQMMGKPEGDPSVQAVYLRVYKTFMEAIDGIDNGVHFMCAPHTPGSSTQAAGIHDLSFHPHTESTWPRLSCCVLLSASP